jgi:hypothetical protein
MFEHQPERFRESEDGVGRFAAGIGKILDREKGAVNVVMPVDQKQLHVGNLAKEQPFPKILLLPAPDRDPARGPLVNFAARKDQEQDQEHEQEELE